MDQYLRSIGKITLHKVYRPESSTLHKFLLRNCSAVFFLAKKQRLSMHQRVLVYGGMIQ